MNTLKVQVEETIFQELIFNNHVSARVPPGAHFTFAVLFFCTLTATIQCFCETVPQTCLKWNILRSERLVPPSALYMPADILLAHAPLLNIFRDGAVVVFLKTAFELCCSHAGNLC